MLERLSPVYTSLLARPPAVAWRSRSFLLLAAAFTLFSFGTIFYRYSSAGVNFLPDPFSSSSSPTTDSFVPTTSWPPPPPHIPDTIPTDKDGHMYPPLYPDITAQEYLLPQQDETLEFPEGRSARFVRFANEQPGVGFNNQLKEV